MNLRTLSESLAPLVASMHPLTDCNALGVRCEAGAVVFDFDTSELDNEIADLTATIARLERSNDQKTETIIDLRAKLREANPKPAK